MLPKFIVFEGFDGSGKTTISTIISEKHKYFYRRSPEGAFSYARKYFDTKIISAEERFSFYMADNIYASSLAKRLIGEDKRVLFDRYFYSTIAYHEIIKKGISKNFENIISSLAIPDLIFFLDVKFDLILKRIKIEDKSTNDPLFFNEESYIKINKLYSRMFSDNFIIVNNNGSIDSTLKKIEAILMKY